MSGVAIKKVKCEECGTKYVYQLRREVVGSGNSLYFLDNQGAERRAQSRAKVELEKQLAEECDAVPCLNCGHYQRNMVRKIKKRYSWLPWVVIIAILCTLVFAAVTWAQINDPVRPRGAESSIRNALIATAVLGVISVAGAVAWVVLIFYNPNSAPIEKRKSKGRELALTREEYEELVKQQQTRES